MDSTLFWCGRCKTNLSPDSFYYQKNGKRDSVCKKCRSDYYYQNKDAIIFNAFHIRRKVLIDEIIVPLKAKGCTDCSKVFIPEAMDFDHVRGEKAYEISRLPSAPVSDEEMIVLLKAELALCEVCCANCHRRRTLSRYKTSTRIDFLNGRTSKRLNEKVLYAYENLIAQGCIDCGISDLLVLEFDHARGTKITSVGRMLGRDAYSLSDVIQEIAKCEVRCVNCHRIKTFQRRSIITSVKREKRAVICGCGAKKDYSAIECRDCYKRTKCNRQDYPSLDEIIVGVETYGWQPYAKTLGLSDNGLKKLAKRLGADPLPQKKRRTASTQSGTTRR